MYEISSISCLAIEYLMKNKSVSRNHINEINLSKKYLMSELKKMNFNFLNTFGNFFILI